MREGRNVAVAAMVVLCACSEPIPGGAANAPGLPAPFSLGCQGGQQLEISFAPSVMILEDGATRQRLAKVGDGDYSNFEVSLTRQGDGRWLYVYTDNGFKSTVCRELS